jgi:hypothetical protein
MGPSRSYVWLHNVVTNTEIVLCAVLRKWWNTEMLFKKYSWYHGCGTVTILTRLVSAWPSAGHHSGCGFPTHVLHRQWWGAVAGGPIRVHPHEVWWVVAEWDTRRISTIISGTYWMQLWMNKWSHWCPSNASPSLFVLRCVRGLHFPHYGGTNAALHFLQQEERGGLTELRSTEHVKQLIEWCSFRPFTPKITKSQFRAGARASSKLVPALSLL